MLQALERFCINLGKVHTSISSPTYVYLVLICHETQGEVLSYDCVAICTTGLTQAGKDKS